jgi:branched-chain amino acid transport system ATP-binding protein
VIVLRCVGLNKKFGGLFAVRNFDLRVDEGEIVGLIGPNGAGKTTLVNLISGYYKPDSGKIIFNGKDITGMKPYKVCREGIARTFQVPQPLRNLSVFDNVRMGAIFGGRLSNKEADDFSLKILEKVGMLNKKDVRAGNLTFVEVKIMQLAVALACKPRLLLLDELMSGLNPVEISQMIELIKKLQNEEKLTLIVIEHIIEAVMRLSNRVVVMAQGEKIAEGHPSKIVEEEKVIEVYLGREVKPNA